jgi:hypothetical protein
MDIDASHLRSVGVDFLKQAISNLTPDTPPCESVDRVEDIDYDTFWTKYMYPNKPVIIRGLTKGWRSMGWIRDGKPDFQRLRKDFGADMVCVAKCGKRHFSDQVAHRFTES